MKKYLPIIILFIVLIVIIIILAILFNARYNEQLDEQLQGEIAPIQVCPPCDCKITAERIISNNPIDLPDGLIKFRYKDKIYTKSQLEAIK